MSTRGCRYGPSHLVLMFLAVPDLLPGAQIVAQRVPKRSPPIRGCRCEMGRGWQHRRRAPNYQGVLVAEVTRSRIRGFVQLWKKAWDGWESLAGVWGKDLVIPLGR